MPEPKSSPTFDKDVLPHLDAAYSLAWWLMRNEQDAQVKSRGRPVRE